ncbi:MAG: polysaccharide deacetylase family protein [Pseudomonadota bacterium]
MLKTDLKRITLSFDNGPDPETTPFVLDILARRNIRTTFFVVGQNLEKARAPAERAAAEGHWIGNHTWSHSHPFRTNGDIEFVRAEIERTQELMGTLAHPSKLFRPFGGGGRLDGALNRTATDHLSAGGYTCVLWNAVPGDFRDKDGWPQVAAQQIAARDWPLVVLHDIYAGAMRHLDGFLGTLQDQGYSFEQDFPPDCIAMQGGIHTKVMSEGVLAN